MNTQKLAKVENKTVATSVKGEKWGMTSPGVGISKSTVVSGLNIDSK